MIERLLPNASAEVRGSFVRLLAWTFAAGVAMVALAIGYLAWMDALSTVSVIAMTLGVFLSVLLGAGLMAMGFLSSNSGHDEWAARFGGATDTDEDA